MHEDWMRHCFGLAQNAVIKGNHPFGALLVYQNQIILEAENTVITQQDCTRHAELNLVSQAERQFSRQELSQATLYTSTEPCPMCTGAIYWSPISEVVFGCSGALLGEISGDKIALSCREIFALGQRQIRVEGPLLEEEAAQQHRNFW